jgi:hypothetical protein
MRLLGEGTGAAQARFDGLGRSTTTMQTLDRQIVHTRGEVKRLAEEFNSTRDAGTLVRLFNVQRDLKDLEKLKTSFGKALGDGGREGAKQTSAAMQGGLSTPVLGPVLVGAIVAAVAAALPMVNGLLLSAVGLGGIGLGIAGQFRDPAVHAAFAAMGHDLSDVLTATTVSFRKPLIGTAAIFGDSLKDALRSIDFTSLSGLVQPLARGFGGLVTEMMPGFNKALAAAQPILLEFAHMLPDIGRAVSDMFASFAKGGKGAAEGLRALEYILVGFIVTVGKVVEVGSKLFEWFVAAGDKITELQRHFLTLIPGLSFLADMLPNLWHGLANGSESVGALGRSFTQLAANAAMTSDDIGKLINQMNTVTNTMDTAAAAISQKVFNQFMSVDQATLSWHQSLSALHDALVQNGHDIDENHEKGQANVQAIYAAVTANMQQYQAMIAAGAGADAATSAYDANTAALEAQLHKAHYTQAEIDGLIGKYRAIPDTVNTDLAVHGLTDAINNLGSLIAKINHLDGRDFGFTVTETDIRRQINEPGNFGHVQRFGGIRRAALGMIVPPRDPGTLIGEPTTGGEANIPLRGISPPRAAWLGQTAMAGYGLDVVPRGGRFVAAGTGRAGSATTINLYVNAGMGTDGRQVGQQVVDALRSYVTLSGGNVQQTIMRRQAA